MSLTKFDQRVKCYCLQNGKEVIFGPNGNCVLQNNGDGNVFIAKWEIQGLTQPTNEQLMAFTEQELSLLPKQALKARYNQVKMDLPKKEPKFALVYEMIKEICLTKLNMTQEEYDTMSQTIFNRWVDL